MRGNATRDLAGLQFVIINKLRFKGTYSVDIIAPNAVKKLATGNGKAKKQELYEALPESTQKAFDELGVKKTTGRYDLTDAYWIAMAIKEKHK
jgi:Holliday junction resolvasome RuvABC endonuclease subunit